MAAHKSFKTSERLAPLAIISIVRFSAARRDSAFDGVLVFGPCFDSGPAGCTTLMALLNCISSSGLRRDRGTLHVDWPSRFTGSLCQTVIPDAKKSARSFN